MMLGMMYTHCCGVDERLQKEYKMTCDIPGFAQKQETSLSRHAYNIRLQIIPNNYLKGIVGIGEGWK